MQKLIKHSNCEVQFFPTHCLILDRVTKAVKGVGKARNGLYYLDRDDMMHVVDKTVTHTCLNSFKTENTFELWHNRLGYASLSKLEHIQCVKPWISPKHSKVFLTCPMSKFTKLPFNLSESHAAVIFELVHMDMWGH